MPQVPSYGGPKIGPAPIPNNQVRTTAPREAFGGGESTSAAFDQAGRTADASGRIFGKERQEAFEISNQEVFAKLSQKEAELNASLKKSQGKDSQIAADNILTDFDKFYGELEKGLGDERLKRSAKAHYNRHRTNLYSAGQSHAATQMRVVDQNEFLAARSSEKDNGLGSVLSDPSLGRFRQSVDAITALTVGKLRREGQSEKAIAYAAKDAVSEMNMGALETMLNNGFDLRATEFYQANKDAFTAKDRQQADKMLELGSILGEATRQADKIYQEAPSRSEANKLAANIENRKVRDAVEDRLDNLYRRADIAAEADYQKEAENTFKMVSSKVAPGDTASEVVGSVKWGKLKEKDQIALNKLYRVVNGLEEPANDWSKVTAFNLMKPAQLAALTEDQLMREYRPYMDDTTYKNATETVNKARQGGGEDVFSDEQNIFRAMQEHGVAGMTWGDDMESVRKDAKAGGKAEMYGRFSTAVQRRYRMESDVKKGKLTPDEKQKILDGMLLRVRVNGVEEIMGVGAYAGPGSPFKTGRTLYGEKSIFQLGPQDRIPTGDIPTEDWDVILNNIQSAEAKNGWKFKDPRRVGEQLRAAYLAGNKAEWARLLKERD